MKTRFLLLGAALLAALIFVPLALAEGDVVETTPGDAGFVIMGSKTGNGQGIVRIRTDEDNNGTYEHAASPLFPYPGSAVGDGVRVAIGDFNGDGNEELVTAAGKGVPVKIWTINPDGSIGDLIDSQKVFGSRGVFVAAGDINNDGVDELLTAAASGQPTVKSFHDTDADLKVFDNPVETFLAFPGTFHGGVRVAAGNTNNLGGEELITAQGPGGRQIKIWTDTDADAQVSDLATNPIIETFPAYGGSFKGGLYVAAFAIQSVGSGGADLVVGPGAGKQKVKIFTDANLNGHVSDDPLFESFFPYGSSWDKGVRVAVGDTDHSGFFVEVLAGPGASGGSKPVKIYDDTDDPGAFLSDNALSGSFIGAAGKAGVYPAFGRVNSGTYAFTQFPQTIADLATLNTTVTVPASAGKIRDLDLALNLFHSFDGDLDVTLTHVTTGTSVILFQDVGGSNEGFLIRLNDESGTDISAATNPKADGPIDGTFNPGGVALLSAFDGQDASGDWRLTIVDDSGGDSGTLYGWSLIITY